MLCALSAPRIECMFLPVSYAFGGIAPYVPVGTSRKYLFQLRIIKNHLKLHQAYLTRLFKNVLIFHCQIIGRGALLLPLCAFALFFKDR